MTAAILTVSDSAFDGTRADSSGPALVEECRRLSWDVAAKEIVPDDAEEITRRLRVWIDSQVADVLLTTGGTGISGRDVTPEATRVVIEKELPGVGELIRTRGLEQTAFAPLSRGLAGTCRRCLIVNLPGSPKGAVHSLHAIAYLLPHIVQLLRGETQDHPFGLSKPAGEQEHQS